MLMALGLNSLIFNGEEDDVYEWASQIDHYFSVRDVPEEQCLSMVSYHLEGDALVWFQWLEANCSLTTWTSFLLDVKFHFGSSQFENAEGRLLKLYQSGSVAEYQMEFEVVRSKVIGISEAVLISIYSSGSKLDIRKGLQLNRPISLAEAFQLARELEKMYQDSQTEMKLDCPNPKAISPAESSTSGESTLRALHDPASKIGDSSKPSSVSVASQNPDESVAKKIMPMYFQKDVKGMICEGFICQGNDTKAQFPNDKSSDVSEYVQFFHVSGKHEKGQDGLCSDSSYSKNKHIRGDLFVDVARRRSVLKFYALAEVYKELF